MKQPNPNYRPVRDGETIGVGLFGDRTYVDKWDDKHHAIRREWSDGTIDIDSFPFDAKTPVTSDQFIFHKREK